MNESTPTFYQTWRSRLRWIVIGVLSLLFLILIFQNLETVEVRLLFTVVSMPRAILLAGIAAFGFVVGALWGRSKSV